MNLTKLLELAKQAFGLTQRLQKLEEKVKNADEAIVSQRDDHAELREEVKTMAATIELMKQEIRHHRESTTKDFEGLVLRLENALLRHERALPSPPPVPPAIDSQ